MKVPQHNSTLSADTEKQLKRTPLRRRTALGAGDTASGRLSRSSRSRKRAAISPASPAQRKKVRDKQCIVTGLDRHEATIDPAHLVSRSHGGCDDPLCVIPLERSVHRRFDGRGFDLLPYLRPSGDERRYLPEILHALNHYDGDLIGLLQRLTGERWTTE